MRKTGIIGLILLALSVFSGFGQQKDVFFSQYWVNGLALNPAYTGSREVFTLSTLYQKKWTGIDGSPVNYTFSAHTPMKNEKVALGLFVMNQSYGVHRNTQVHFNYAYRFNLGNGKFSLGLRGGASFINEDMARLMSGLDDPTDPVFAAIDQNYVQPDFGFGAYFYNPKYFVGFSIPNMLNYQLDTASFKYSPSASPDTYSYTLTAGILIGKQNAFLKWKPSFLVVYNQAYSSLRYDINSNFILFNDFLWVGVSYRSGGYYPSPVLIGNIELHLTKQFMLGYSYDYNMGTINNALNGTHEIMLRYEFGFTVNASDPRYF